MQAGNYLDIMGYVKTGWFWFGEQGLSYIQLGRAWQAFYDTTLFWQWMRMPGDIVFAAGALLMAWDFLVKLRPLVSRGAARSPGSTPPLPLTREETP